MIYHKKYLSLKILFELKAVLFAPHGFGEHLKQGSLLTLQNGLTIEAKAIVLEIEKQTN